MSIIHQLMAIRIKLDYLHKYNENEKTRTKIHQNLKILKQFK